MDWLTGLFSDPATAPAAYGLTGLVLLLAIVFAVTRLRHMRRGMFISGGRKHRLAVLDATAIDNRRRLVLVRRDDVEHLLLIGGNNDVVVESGAAGVKETARPATDDGAKQPVMPKEPDGASKPARPMAETGRAQAAPVAPAAPAEPPRQPQPRPVINDGPQQTQPRPDPKLDPVMPAQPSSVVRAEPRVDQPVRPAEKLQAAPPVRAAAAPRPERAAPSDPAVDPDNTLDDEMDKLLEGILDTPTNQR